MESIDFTCQKQFIFIANFHVLGLFIPQKRVLSEEKNPSVHPTLFSLKRLPSEALIFYSGISWSAPDNNFG
jgi:hypothetical protein